jgi:hypothetical protein
VKDNFDLEEEERGRPRSRECERIIKEKRHMTHDDVDELVRWVSSKDIRREAALLSANEDQEKEFKHKEEEKRQGIGMSTDDGSVSHLNIQDLVQHARKTNGDKTAEPALPTGVEVGDLRCL